MQLRVLTRLFATYRNLLQQSRLRLLLIHLNIPVVANTRGKPPRAKDDGSHVDRI